MQLRLALGLQAYPKKAKPTNPPTLAARSVSRATTVGKLAVATVLLAGISMSRATTAGALATPTVGLAGVSVGRSTTSARIVTTRLLAGASVGRAATVGKFPATTTHLLAGITVGRATTAAALTVTGTAPEFSPTSIPGLQLWFDASQITGKVDGDLVTTLSDLSGNARDATQATAAAQPLYKVAIQNGKPVVRFDGVDDFLRTATTFTITQPDTIIIAAHLRSADSVARYMVGAGSDGSARQFLRRNSTKYTMFAGSTITAQPGTSVPAWGVVTGVFNNPSETFLNGVSIISGVGGTEGSQGLSLAVSYANGGFADLDMAECLVYNTALSTADRQAVERYLGTKWGVTVA